jgi:DNA-binding XRE family transcriptional regulator
VTIMHGPGGQRDQHRDNQRGDGVGVVRPMSHRPTARVTLRQMREQAGIPLAELAARAGVSISTLRKFEAGIPDLATATYAHTISALEALAAGPES